MDFLVGKKIRRVYQMSEADAEALAWYQKPFIIEFTDGSILIPQSDNEGNNGGAMWYQDDMKDELIYTES